MTAIPYRPESGNVTAKQKTVRSLRFQGQVPSSYWCTVLSFSEVICVKRERYVTAALVAPWAVRSAGTRRTRGPGSYGNQQPRPGNSLPHRFAGLDRDPPGPLSSELRTALPGDCDACAVETGDGACISLVIFAMS